MEQLYVFGTGNAAVIHYYNTCFAIRNEDRFFMVDAGGGNTIAWIPAAYDMDVIDCGVPVLSMHAPWEITSKSDIYEAEKCYEAFLKTKDWI